MDARAGGASFGERLVESEDTAEDAEWAEIIAELPDDIESEPYAFSTGDYPTHEEGMAALWRWMCTLGNGDSNDGNDSEPDRASA